MKYYLAPMEGITTFIYRNAIRDVFGDGAKKYFTPFFSPNTKRHASSYAIRGILPENNTGIRLIPQILTNDAVDFLAWEKDMRRYGYEELNINIGCPSGTVVSKKRGAGFLREPDRIDDFLDEIFQKTQCRISVKTRLGMEEPEEFLRLMEVYEKYPLEELIVHARVGRELYSGRPHVDVFRRAAESSRLKMVYNGDIRKPEDLQMLPEECDTVMIGRGVIANPALLRILDGGESASAAELEVFLRKLRRDYLAIDPDENHTLFKLKEIWTYLQEMFPEEPQEIRKLMKSKRIEEYRVHAVNLIRTLR